MELLEWMPPSGSQLALGKAFLVPTIQLLQKPFFSSQIGKNQAFKGKIENSGKTVPVNFRPL
jgi:hypothetical protein